MIAGNALRKRMPRRDAISAPVHAPVPGSGTPTNSARPQNSYLSICSLLPRARDSSFSTIGRNSLVFLSRLKIGVISSRIKGTGIILPITQYQMALTIGMFRRDAARSPPLSYRIGTMEMTQAIIYLENFPTRTSIKHVTKPSIYSSFLLYIRPP